jgi:hypothetical protein
MAQLRREVKAALEDGTRCGCRTTSGSCAEILRVRASLWTFARGGGPAHEQRGGACPEARGDLASDQRGHRQRTGESVRGADADGGGDLPATGAQRPGLPDVVLPSRSERPRDPLSLAGDGTGDQSRLIPVMLPNEPLQLLLKRGNVFTAHGRPLRKRRVRSGCQHPPLVRFSGGDLYDMPRRYRAERPIARPSRRRENDATPLVVYGPAGCKSPERVEAEQGSIGPPGGADASTFSEFRAPVPGRAPKSARRETALTGRGLTTETDETAPIRGLRDPIVAVWSLRAWRFRAPWRQL